jgi:uncharacterized protein (TIGR03067 family)
VHRNAFLFLSVASLLPFLTASAEERTQLQVPFGIEGTPEHGKDASRRTARELGLRLKTFQTRWLESEPGQYSWAVSPGDDRFLEELRELHSQGYIISIDYTNIFMDHKHLPRYVEGKNLDDAYLLKRWEAHLKAFLERYGDSIDLLSFGLEVDTYFGRHPSEWRPFLTFFRRGAALTRTLRPKIKVSVTLQSGGLDRFWKDIAPDCDFLSTTYYAPCSAFGKSPTAEALDPNHPRYCRRALDRILRAAGKKKVLLREVGCPSHEAVDSSPEVQAKFVRVFFGWLRDHQGSMLGASWVGMTDWPWEHTKTALKGQLDDALLKDGPFLRFVTSLGLKYENGREKPAFEVLRLELINPGPPQPSGLPISPRQTERDEALEGTWRVVSSEFSGVDFAGLRGAKLILANGKKTFVLPDGTVEKGSYDVAAGKPARHIDATTEGRAGTAVGIYEVVEKKLKMCLSQSGASRPDGFKTKGGDDRVLIVLERAPKD